MQLTAPRDQLSRISSRLKQLGGLASLELAWEMLAFAHVGVSAALEAAFSEATNDAFQKLRSRSYTVLSAPQVAAIAESSFIGFFDAERARGTFKPDRALGIREDLVEEIRGLRSRPGGTKSVLEKTGVPDRDHFRLFFKVVTGGSDPRTRNVTAPLERLVGRVNEIAGPRNVFAHECAEPSTHEFVVGSGSDWGALAASIAALDLVIADLHELFDALEAACEAL
jgi:hypothetical protein